MIENNKNTRFDISKIKDLSSLKSFMKSRDFSYVLIPELDMLGFSGLTPVDGFLWGLHIPVNVMYIDDSLRGDEFFETLRHEIEEYCLIIDDGLCTWDAHRIALRHEKKR
jgi:hypothetical protein